MSDRMSERRSDSMSERMSEDMSEDLPDRTASSRSQCFLPDLNRELRITVAPARPQPGEGDEEERITLMKSRSIELQIA